MKRTFVLLEPVGRMPDEPTETEAGSRCLPDDLSLYLGKKTVVKLVLDAVQLVVGESVDYTWFAQGGKTFQRPMMLTLLTYCYATGAYGAVDIELNTRHDQMTRYLCARTYPDIDAIRGFRRLNRPQIRECLAVVLKRAWELRFSDEQAGNRSDSDPGNWQTLKFTEPLTREAEERVARAVRTDSMTLDE